MCRGREVWLLKRAQIFVGDVWGAFGGRGCGAFHDIGCLTAFAGMLSVSQPSLKFVRMSCDSTCARNKQYTLVE